MNDFSPDQALQATAGKRPGWQVGRHRAAVPELIRSADVISNCALFAMKVLKRSNRFYDTQRFGQPQIRLRHRKGIGLKSPSYVLRCGCCDQKLEIFYSDGGLEIGGVNGALEDWREILLPVLLIERRRGQLVDLAPKTKKSANKPVQRTGASRVAHGEIRTSSAAGSRR